MPTKLFSLRSAVCAFLLLSSFSSANAFGQTLKQVVTFDLPGPGGKRFDYLTIDADDRYLISAHLAAGQTYVIDLGTNKVVATTTDTPGAEGVEYVPELKNLHLERSRQHHRCGRPQADEGREEVEDRSEAVRKHLRCALSQTVRFR